MGKNAFIFSISSFIFIFISFGIPGSRLAEILVFGGCLVL
jgi:hypothetical protein